MKNKYSLFIGRWQNFHAGHEWLINQQLNQGKKVWVAVRDVEVDGNNPYTAQQVLVNLMNQKFFQDNILNIFVSIIPDIESVNYGRGVGYEVIYHEPPQEIASISGTQIRKENGTS
jgi:nicotinamide mononucleotide adenylyltransferase